MGTRHEQRKRFNIQDFYSSHKWLPFSLWGSYVQGDGVGGELSYFHHLRSAGEEILNPVSRVKSLGLKSVSLKASLVGTIVLKAEL